jgi:hypothetical protein
MSDGAATLGVNMTFPAKVANAPDQKQLGDG